MKHGRYILIALLTAAGLLAADVPPAAAEASAHAVAPSYDGASLELVGSGSYVTSTRHSQLRVTVCLRKRFGKTTFTVRCNTVTGSGRRVHASVGVPGCVKGVWRTAVTGEALSRKGQWVAKESALSPLYRC